MTDDDLLAQELGKIGRLAGEVGGTLHGVGRMSSAPIFLSVQAVTRFLPTEIFSEQLLLHVPADNALRLGFSILSRLGELQKKGTEDAPYPSLSAVVKAGFFNLNPSVIYFEIRQGDSSSCTVTVTGAAKEGLIRQQIAKKVVQRVTANLREAVGQFPI